jgi:hypothetical protein
LYSFLVDNNICICLQKQIQNFLNLPGVSKANFCAVALNGTNRKALDKLLRSTTQDGQARCHTSVSNSQSNVYHLAIDFFQKKSIYDERRKQQIGSDTFPTTANVLNNQPSSLLYSQQHQHISLPIPVQPKQVKSPSTTTKNRDRKRKNRF